jgi:hypothetical protein
MKRPMLRTARDKTGAQWGFETAVDPAHLDEMREAGIEIFEVVASVPGWVVRLGLSRPWASAQAAWQWLRIW